MQSDGFKFRIATQSFCEDGAGTKITKSAPGMGAFDSRAVSAFLKLTPSSSTSGYWERKFYEPRAGTRPDRACLAVQSP
jgi:hypothetical protein